jgi:hypothetical protein
MVLMDTHVHTLFKVSLIPSSPFFVKGFKDRTRSLNFDRQQGIVLLFVHAVRNNAPVLRSGARFYNSSDGV